MIDDFVILNSKFYILHYAFYYIINRVVIGFCSFTSPAAVGFKGMQGDGS